MVRLCQPRPGLWSPRPPPPDRNNRNDRGDTESRSLPDLYWLPTVLLSCDYRHKCAGKPAAGTPPITGKPAAGARPDARAPKAAGQKPPGGVDRLELNTATVTGDREQPKVMYIVPWKSSDIGDLSGKPMNSLLDEALAPVDRDEFKREVVYFDVVKADRSQNGTSGGTPKQGEK